MKIVPNKNLPLTAKEMQTWKYWSYGYWGSDGCDWRGYRTDKGWQDIPDYADEATPIKAF